MSPEVERQQQKAKEFMSLLPLTLAVAGLPECEVGKHFTESQLEARSTTIRIAYKIARQLIVDVPSDARFRLPHLMGIFPWR